MNRIITLAVDDIYIKAAGEAWGATGAHNAITLRVAFGSAWDGTTKTAYFTDALGVDSVSIVLGLDKLVAERTYEFDVPSEALKEAGDATLTIKGVKTSGSTVTMAITTAAGHFRVLDSEIPGDAGDAGTIPASDKEQLQAEIDALELIFTTNKTAAETAAANAAASAAAAADARDAILNMGATAESLPTGQDARVEKLVAADGTVTLKFGLPRGEKGEQGKQGDRGADGGGSFSVHGTTLVIQPGVYTGAYNVKSAVGGDDVVLNTANKLLEQNVTVENVKQSEVSNLSGGKTLIIGD